MTRKHAFFALQAVGTLVLVGLLLRGFDWTAFRALFARTPAWFYLLSFGAVALGQALYALRWWLLLRALDVRVAYARVVEQYLIGVFFNNFLPSSVGGDWSKVYYLGSAEGYVRIGASVIVDRLIGVTLAASLAMVLLWGPGGELTGAAAAARGVLTLTWLGLAGVFLSVIVIPADSWMRAVGRRVPSLAGPLEAVGRIAAHAREALSHPVALIGSVAVVVGYFVTVSLVYQVFIELATGARPPFLAVAAAVTAIATLSNFPIAVNGLGLREQLHFAMLAGFGLSKEGAAGLSLLFFGHLLVLSIVGGALWARRPVAPGRTTAS